MSERNAQPQSNEEKVMTVRNAIDFDRRTIQHVTWRRRSRP